MGSSFAPAHRARPPAGVDIVYGVVDNVYMAVDAVYGGHATRARLVSAARAHLDEHGLEGLTLRGIARRAGVSHGAPLRHFPGLEHLLAAVVAEGFRELRASVAAAVEEAGPTSTSLEQLVAAMRGYQRFAFTNPGVFELTFRHERHAAQEPELLEAGAAAFLQLVDLVAAAQRDGWRAGAHPGELAGVVWASVHGVVSLWLPGTLPSAVALTGASADLDTLLDLTARIVTGRDDVSRPPSPRSRRRTPNRRSTP
jgi:AcrR family transcriptional regulator